MTKLKICFVDDRLAPLNDFLGWSYIKKKEIIDNFIQNNETVIIKEISEELGITRASCRNNADQQSRTT